MSLAKSCCSLQARLYNNLNIKNRKVSVNFFPLTFFSLIFCKLSTIYHWSNEEVNCNPKKYLSFASMQIEFTTSTQEIEREMPEKKRQILTFANIFRIFRFANVYNVYSEYVR